MPRSPSVPAYRLHRPSGQAVVTIRTTDGQRRDVYLGLHNSLESRAEYGRIIAEHATAPHAPLVTRQNGTPVPTRPTVDQIALLFLKHAERHYRRADGTPTDQIPEYRTVIKPLHALYGATAAADFGPLALKTVRKVFIDADNCRTLINSRVGKIKRLFKWAVSEQLVPVATYTVLATVAGLQAGRSEARESEPVGPVDPAIVDATLPHLNRHVAGMVRFQRLTGCRPGEAAALRRCDLDTSGGVWLYRPAQHKTKHKKKARVIAIGPKAQALLKAFFTDDPAAYLFSPRLAVQECNATRSAARTTPRYPCEEKARVARKATKPKRVPAAQYARQAYLNAISRACDRAGVSHWHPNQLRHTFATGVRKAYGLEAAQVLLGHSKADVTQVYAEKNQTLAAKVVAELG